MSLVTLITGMLSRPNEESDRIPGIVSGDPVASAIVRLPAELRGLITNEDGEYLRELARNDYSEDDLFKAAQHITRHRDREVIGRKARNEAMLEAAKRELRLCYVAYKRHAEEESLDTIWDYWELLGAGPEKYADGRAVFRSYVQRRLDYVRENGPRWLFYSIKKNFKEIGFDVYIHD